MSDFLAMRNWMKYRDMMNFKIQVIMPLALSVVIEALFFQRDVIYSSDEFLSA